MRHTREKKLLALLLAVFLLAGALPLTASAAYTSNWINWSQGASAIGGHMKKYGCRIVAQAKLLKEAGILANGVDPDSYGKWANGKGYFAKGKSLVNKVTEEAPQGTAPVAYAKAVGKTLTYGGQVNFSSRDKTSQSKQIMEWLKQGYYVIVGCDDHHAYIPRKKSMDNNTAYISESQSGLTNGYVKKYTEYSAKSGGSPIVFTYARLYKTGAASSCPPHTKSSFLFFEAAHPHHNCYACSKCGETIVDYSSSNKYKSCKECYPPQASTDVVTGGASNISTTGATLTGSIQPKGASVTEIGLHFGTSKNDLPWVWSEKNIITDGEYYYFMKTTSSFQTLKPNTTYYFQVYAYQGGKYIYGSVESFTTKAAPSPTVSTTVGAATEITSNSAKIPVQLKATNTTLTSVTLHLGTSKSSQPYLTSRNASGRDFSYTFSLDSSCGLKPNTTYYYTACGIDVSGKYYWSETKSFTTLSAKENTYSLSYYYYSNSQKNGHEEKTSEELPCRFVVRSPEDARKGYAFKGWSWKKNSTIPEYQPGDIVEIEENRTLYAVWEPDGTIAFEDVTIGTYYYDAVDWAVEKGITAGTDKTHFSPNASCTRAQAVTFLWRAAGEPEPAGTGEAFGDVNANAYYEKAVQWAVEQGITSGTGNGKFSPNSTCTRAQIVTFLYRAENQPAISGGSGFTDVPSGQYYENAVKWAVENGITSGTGNGRFSPDNNCIRGQIVTFLYRYSK